MKRFVVPVVTAAVTAGLVGFFAGPADAAGKYKPDATIDGFGDDIYNTTGDDQVSTAAISHRAEMRVQNEGKRKDRYVLSANLDVVDPNTIVIRYDVNNDGSNDAGDPDITQAVEDGTYKTPKVKPGRKTLRIWVEVSVPMEESTTQAIITATSVHNPAKRDMVIGHAFNPAGP